MTRPYARPTRRLLRAILAVTAALAVAPPALAETREDFARRISEAYRSADKAEALRAMFLIDGVDSEMMKLYEKGRISRLLGDHDAPGIAFEPMPKGKRLVYVRDGFKYAPNLEPLGRVVFDGRTKVPYGRKGDRFYLVAVTRRLVSPDAPPDRALTMTVMSFGYPRIAFSGHCDVMQSDHTTRRLSFVDRGINNNTMATKAQHIHGCEVTNLSGRGRLKLKLIEAGEIVFDETADAPELSLVYRHGDAAR